MLCVSCALAIGRVTNAQVKAPTATRNSCRTLLRRQKAGIRLYLHHRVVRTITTRVAYGAKCKATESDPFVVLTGNALTDPVCASQSSARPDALDKVAVVSNGCPPSLNSRYTSASFRRRFITRSAVSGAVVLIVAGAAFSTASRMAGATACGSGGAVGGN